MVVPLACYTGRRFRQAELLTGRRLALVLGLAVPLLALAFLAAGKLLVPGS